MARNPELVSTKPSAPSVAVRDIVTHFDTGAYVSVVEGDDVDGIAVAFTLADGTQLDVHFNEDRTAIEVRNVGLSYHHGLGINPIAANVIEVTPRR